MGHGVRGGGEYRAEQALNGMHRRLRAGGSGSFVLGRGELVSRVAAQVQRAQPAAMASMVSTPRGQKMWLSMNE